MKCFWNFVVYGFFKKKFSPAAPVHYVEEVSVHFLKRLGNWQASLEGITTPLPFHHYPPPHPTRHYFVFCLHLPLCHPRKTNLVVAAPRMHHHLEELSTCMQHLERSRWSGIIHAPTECILAEGCDFVNFPFPASHIASFSTFIGS